MAPPKMHAVALVAYPGAQTAAVLGLRDLLEAASRLQREVTSKGPGLQVHVLEVSTLPKRPAPPFTALVLPPCLEPGGPCLDAAPLVGWLVARHAEGTILCSVCAGAFLLAETGLLSGRPATTHWNLRERFSARFPDVLLDTDRLIVDDGDILTAGGVMAWIDLGLLLIDRFLGPSTMLKTARHFLVDPGGREQRFYAVFAPCLSHGDAQILKAQHWLQRRFRVGGEGIRRAACEPRSDGISA